MVLEKLAEVEVATLGHVTDFGFPRGLVSIVQGLTFVGHALTVKIPHLDSTAVHYALDLVQPGDVIVIDQSGDDVRSSFGGGLATVAKAKGCVGAVSNGSTNDVAELRELRFPVYSRGITPHTTRVLGIEGAVNVPVSIGGVVVLPGDVVVADEDGLAVIGSQDADRVADELVAKEKAIRAKNLGAAVQTGAGLAALTGAKELFEAGAGQAS